MIEEGMVFDVLSEADNDENGDYCEVATQVSYSEMKTTRLIILKDGRYII